jgi:putative transposase
MRLYDFLSKVVGVRFHPGCSNHPSPYLIQSRTAIFFRKLLKPVGFTPRVLITDKLKSYGAAKRKLLKGVEHKRYKGLNNRAENSHRLTWVRERRMGRFKSPGQAQRFLSAFEPIRGHFHPHQHKLPATEYRETMSQRFESWRELTGLNAAA